MRTGENIYKRKDGRWEARYSKGRNEDGRIIYGFCYGKTYSEAKEKVEQAKRHCAQNQPQIYGRTPLFGEICNEWMNINKYKQIKIEGINQCKISQCHAKVYYSPFGIV